MTRIPRWPWPPTHRLTAEASGDCYACATRSATSFLGCPHSIKVSSRCQGCRFFLAAGWVGIKRIYYCLGVREWSCSFLCDWTVVRLSEVNRTKLASWAMGGTIWWACSSGLPSWPILNRLRQVHCLDLVTPRQIGDGPRQLQNPVIRPRAHIQLLHRRPQQDLANPCLKQGRRPAGKSLVPPPAPCRHSPVAASP